MSIYKENILSKESYFEFITSCLKMDANSKYSLSLDLQNILFLHFGYLPTDENLNVTSYERFAELVNQNGSPDKFARLEKIDMQHIEDTLREIYYDGEVDLKSFCEKVNFEIDNIKNGEVVSVENIMEMLN